MTFPITIFTRSTLLGTAGAVSRIGIFSAAQDPPLPKTTAASSLIFPLLLEVVDKVGQSVVVVTITLRSRG